ncbi:MAG: hypothetical protein RLZZ11_1067 [Cyanobacteriota bacterium]|jgi:hypothetical protein
MDSDPPPRTSAQTTKTGDGPYSSGSFFHTAAPLLGLALGICTLVLPLATVISDRGIPPASTHAATADGFAQSAGLTGARAGESDGGDPRR